MKQNKYDDEQFFEKYAQMSRSKQGLAGAGEWSTLEKLLPSFEGKRVLDLGCGYGWHCDYAVRHGASVVVGTDISEKMLQTAREKNAASGIKYICLAMEDIDFEANSFDIVLSSLAFHYIKDFNGICQKVNKLLSSGGEFIFSVEHPIFTARGDQQWIANQAGQNLYWPVDNYFIEGERKANFLGDEVIKYHKTITTYLNSLIVNEFEITAIVEPQPNAEMLANVPGMEDELRRPMMLIVSARKK